MQCSLSAKRRRINLFYSKGIPLSVYISIDKPYSLTFGTALYCMADSKPIYPLPLYDRRTVQHKITHPCFIR